MNKKIKCIERLLEVNFSYPEITQWLIEQKLTSLAEVQSKIHLQEKSEFIYYTLKQAEVQEKIILLDFEWSILPIELIRITCVTDREKKEFTYGH